MPLLALDNTNLFITSDLKKEFHALKDISLSVERGELVALVGHSGAGKTLLSFLLGGLIQSDPSYQISGSALFTFEDIQYDLTQPDTKALLLYRRKNVSLIFQDPYAALNPTIKCGKQILNILLLSNKNSKKNRVNELLQEVGFVNFEKVYNSYPHQLSGGECQRVVITMAMAKQPQLIIADEPTSSLDNENEKLILNLIIGYCHEFNIALILVSHNTTLISAHVNRFLILNNGRLHYSGPMPVIDEINDDYITGLFSPYADSTSLTGDSSPSENTILSLKNINFSYSQKNNLWSLRQEKIPILNNLNLALRQGEIVGIFGQSGSGKSTIAKIITRLIDIESGDILFNKKSLLSIPINTKHPFRNKIQLILQDNFSSFNPAYSIKDSFNQVWKNIHHSAYVRTTHGMDEQIIAVLAQVSLPERLLDMNPSQLSGGQRQRVMIARSLLFDPGILICDESVAAVDMHNRSKILGLLMGLVKDRGMTVLFISHDLASINYVSNRIFELKEGQLIRRDIHHD